MALVFYSAEYLECLRVAFDFFCPSIGSQVVHKQCHTYQYLIDMYPVSANLSAQECEI